MNKKRVQIIVSFLTVIIQTCSGLPTRPIITPTTSSTLHPVTISPTKINTALFTLKPTRTPRPTGTATPLPSWVKEFSEPILAAIKDREPEFQDDFSDTYGKGWYIGFLGDPKYGLTIEKGILFVKRNKGCDPVSNLALTHPNFILQIDLPGNNGDVEYHGFMGGGPRYFFTVRDEGTTIQWSFGSRDSYGTEQFGNLTKNTSSGNVSQAIIIKKGSQAAFYLNNIPLTYVDDPILDRPIYGIMLNCGQYDNVKFWNLDKISNLP